MLRKDSDAKTLTYRRFRSQGYQVSLVGLWYSVYNFDENIGAD